MKLIRLTSVEKNRPNLVPVVSAEAIAGMEVEVYEDQHICTYVYTTRQGMCFRVKETPEEIEALANSEANAEPNYHHLLQFAQWFGQNRNKYLGRSYAEVVDKYISELRRG